MRVCVGGLRGLNKAPDMPLSPSRKSLRAQARGRMPIFRCTCSHGQEREHARINGCISVYCKLLSLQSAYPGGTEHFLSGPKLNSPPGKTDHPVKCEVGASARQRDKEGGGEGDGGRGAAEGKFSRRSVFAPFVLQSGGASKDVERYLHIRG